MTVPHVRAASCKESSFSAASVAQNEFSLNSAMPAAGVAIANQTQGQVKAGNPASLGDAARTLLVENSVSGVEIKAVDEGESSAAPVPNAEKWSHEAIVAFVKYATGAYAETHALREIRGRIRGLIFCRSAGMIRLCRL